MGKGDRKTKRGKINIGSYGKKRQRKIKVVREKKATEQKVEVTSNT